MVNKVSPRAGGGITGLPREQNSTPTNFRSEMLLLSRIQRKFTGTFVSFTQNLLAEISHITRQVTSRWPQKQSTSRKSVKGIHRGYSVENTLMATGAGKLGFPQNFSHFSHSQAQSILTIFSVTFGKPPSQASPSLECCLWQPSVLS